MERHALTVGILIVALCFYAFGLESGAVGAFIVGGALEMWFWVRALRKPGDRSE